MTLVYDYYMSNLLDVHACFVYEGLIFSVFISDFMKDAEELMEEINFTCSRGRLASCHEGLERVSSATCTTCKFSIRASIFQCSLGSWWFDDNISHPARYLIFFVPV